MTEKELLKKIDTYKQDVIDLQTNMIACPAVSPSQGGKGEAAKAAYLMSVLKKMKFDEIKSINVKDPQAPDGYRPNIIATYYGKDRSKTLWVMAHMDVVPAGNLDDWKTDPFKAVVKGDKIYGRGAEDNHQGIVCGLLAVKAFMDLGIRPACNYSLLLNADEEIGSDFGILEILKKHPKTFGKKDVFIVPDGGVADGSMVEVAEKNVMWLEFTVHGKTTHGSTPKTGINAHHASARLIVALVDGLHKKFNKKNALFAPESASTFAATKHEANVPNINTIPGVDVFCMDCRILPCYSNKEVYAEILRIVKKIEKQCKVKVTIKIPHMDSSKPTDKNEPVVKLMTEAVRKVYKNSPKVVGVGGGTVAASLRNAGYPAVVYAKLDETMHQPNEYTSIKNTLGDSKIFALIAYQFK